MKQYPLKKKKSKKFKKPKSALKSFDVGPTNKKQYYLLVNGAELQFPT